MTPALTADVLPLLQARRAEAMFPLSNLARHGEAGHPRSMRFYRHAGAVLGLTEDGVAMPLFPADHDAGWAQGVLAGQRLRGVIGPLASATALLEACGIGSDVLRPAEPQFVLDLRDLILPPGEGRLESLARHRDLATRWRSAFQAELDFPGNEPVAHEIERWIAVDSHRLWLVGDEPVALTGVNAALPDIVQVGGVYVPPGRRGKGFARQAVAAHLAALRGTGVREATLCAASDAAAKAYIALGFRKIGAFSTTIFAKPREVRP